MAFLDVSSTEQGDTVHLALSGELDISTAPRVEEELTAVEARAPAVIVLDLRSLEFMDSTGLRLVVSADGRAQERGGRLVVVRGRESVDRIFRMTKLDDRLTMVDDPPAVVAD
jgi:anti-sigma B factor antagonist